MLLKWILCAFVVLYVLPVEPNYTGFLILAISMPIMATLAIKDILCYAIIAPTIRTNKKRQKIDNPSKARLVKIMTSK